jgi:hypothetical protein
MFGDGQQSLVSSVVECHKDTGKQGDDNGDHHPLQVERIAHVRRAFGDLSRRKQNGIVHFVHWVEFFELAPLVEGLP